MTNSSDRPVRDEGEPYRPVPYRAGGPQGLSGRKSALLNTGSTGRMPPRGKDAHTYEAPPAPTGDDELEPGPRPRPREIPVHSQATHFGNVVRYLDGHSEIHRERPGLAELLGNPHIHEDDKAAIRDEIAARDALHTHKYW